MDTGPGRLGLLLCRVNSDPPAQLRLLHGDRLVTSTLQGVGELAGSSPRLQVAVAPNMLRLEIHNAVLEDEGVYTCEATNALGQALASATFDAQGQNGGVSVCVGGSFKRRGGWRRFWKPETRAGGLNTGQCTPTLLMGSNLQTWFSLKNLF